MAKFASLKNFFFSYIKMEIQGFDLTEVNPLFDYLNLLLKKKCGKAYSLDFELLDDEYYLLELHLNRNNHCVSNIKLEFSSDGRPGVYMHSYTEPKQENKKYNSFLRCVVILLMKHLIYFDTSNTGEKRFEFIGSNTANWISDWLLISKFGFWLNEDDYEPQTYKDLLKFKHLSKQQYSTLRQQFKTTFLRRPPQARGLEYVLDLKGLDSDSYLQLCGELLNAIKC
jgi:hypothetical protein